jgi:hypothetical protein
MGAIRDAAGQTDREFLTALRDHLASTLDGTPPPHTIAGLMKQLMDVRRELAQLDSAEGGDDIGDATSTPDAEFDADTL